MKSRIKKDHLKRKTKRKIYAYDTKENVRNPAWIAAYNGLV